MTASRIGASKTSSGLSVAERLAAFRWSVTGDGTDCVIDVPCFTTRGQAAKAWPALRREAWAACPRFTVPGPARVFDGLTAAGLDVIRERWNSDGPFPLAEALQALAADRAALAAFARTSGARLVAVYIEAFRQDLDAVETFARALATSACPQRYPHEFSTTGTYGGMA